MEGLDGIWWMEGLDGIWWMEGLDGILVARRLKWKNGLIEGFLRIVDSSACPEINSLSDHYLSR